VVQAKHRENDMKKGKVLEYNLAPLFVALNKAHTPLINVLDKIHIENNPIARYRTGQSIGRIR